MILGFYDINSLNGHVDINYDLDNLNDIVYGKTSLVCPDE